MESGVSGVNRVGGVMLLDGGSGVVEKLPVGEELCDLKAI
jgi:hypothetical protein